MKNNLLLKVLKKDKLLIVLLCLSIISLFRSFIIPLIADENTYYLISENILSGRYYFKDYPSTVIPVIPFLLALFSTSKFPLVGFILVKILNIVLFFFGLRFLYLFLKRIDLNIKIIISILLLTIVNPNSIAWFSRIYPESILFFSFWGFVYYYTSEIKLINFKRMLLFFLLLVITRYVYALLGVFVLVYFYNYLKSHKFSIEKIAPIFIIGLIYVAPVLLWFKYVYIIEQSQLSEITYFSRFHSENPILDNIKYGLGVLQSPEVGKINGIPAFVSLFVPITGLRNYIVSVVLIILFIVGYLKVNKNFKVHFLLLLVMVSMVGFVLAGTGFSRYWLILLPSFYLGYYYLFKSFKLKDEWFLKLAKVVAIIYVLNELRLDYIIFNKYL